MGAAIEHIEHCEWTHDGIALQPVLQALGLKSKHMKALYAAITGHTAGLPLFESIEMLGRESALTWLRQRTRAVRLRMRLAFKIAWRTALALFTIVFVYLAVTFFQVWRTARQATRRARRTRSWCSARRSTTAGRHRARRPARSRARPVPRRCRTDHRRHRRPPGGGPVHRGDGRCDVPARTRRARERDPARDERAFVVAVARGRGPLPQGRDQTRVVLVSDPYHAARIDDIAEEVGLHAVTSPTTTSPIKGAAEWRRFGTETLRVGAGRLFGYRRLEQGREMGKLVPGLGTLIALRGWCNRQHNRFWSCIWGFESSPPSAIAHKPRWCRGLRRQPLKVETTGSNPVRGAHHFFPLPTARSRSCDR